MAGLTVSVDVSQLLDFSLRANIAIGAANAAAVRVVAQAVEDIEADAKQLAPKLTHALEGSIKGRASGLVGTVDASIRYAQYVEFGTYKDRPQPFMLPALEANTGKFVAASGVQVASAIAAAL